MLFNSYEFILVFLPLTLLAYYFVGPRSAQSAKLVLVIASLAFYSFWNIGFLPILAGSFLFNWWASQLILSERLRTGQRDVALVGALAINIALLSYYKYLAFFLGLMNGDFSGHGAAANLPLGISFFTFTQIAFLVDARRGGVRDHTFLNYVLFVTVFPHLIAGPILHHRSMIPQFARPQTYRFNGRLVSEGLMLFAMGLAKKVLLADSVGPYADEVFATTTPTFVEAWCGALAYTFQIYFDFSGYSDMAVGLGLMLGLRLPINFNSPYQATSIVEFWRRWHISLSTFLRDYLYIPLGGSRHGDFRRWTNLMVTMLLGGLWHGANLTFVIWGGIHGLCLVINHTWSRFRSRMCFGMPGRAERFVAWLLTFLTIVVTWVFFRAENLAGAWRMLRGLIGLNGVVVPESYASLPLIRWLVQIGLPTAYLPSFSGAQEIAVLAVLAAIAFVAPNSQSTVLGKSAEPYIRRVPAWLLFRPNAGWVLICVALLLVGILGISKESRFLYFQF